MLVYFVIDSNELSLIHDPKLPTFFQSARWKRGYNPDLAIVSNDISNLFKKPVLWTQFHRASIAPLASKLRRL